MGRHTATWLAGTPFRPRRESKETFRSSAPPLPTTVAVHSSERRCLGASGFRPLAPWTLPWCQGVHYVHRAWVLLCCALRLEQHLASTLWASVDSASHSAGCMSPCRSCRRRCGAARELHRPRRGGGSGRSTCSKGALALRLLAGTKI